MLVSALALFLTTAPPLAVAFQPPIGLSDAETATAEHLINAEVAALGLDVMSAAAVDPACVPDVACVEAARAASGQKALLVVELARVGPVVQLTATGAAAAGGATGARGLTDDELAHGPLLPDGVRAWVKELGAPPPAPPPPPAVTKAPLPFTAAQSGALFAAGLGGLAFVGGAILTAGSESVLETGNAPAAEKAQAVTSGWIGVAATVVGVGALGGAAALFLWDPK